MPKAISDVKIYGHRGAKKIAPENTIPAFEKTLEMGADGFELDTMLSADGIPVVIHDRSLSRTTNGNGYVDQKTISELKNLDAGGWFSEKYCDVRIPLLSDVLKTFGKKAQINIELKNFTHPFNSLPDKVYDLVCEECLLENILFSSFIPFNLVRIRKKNPNARVALLFKPDLPGKLFATSIFQSISPDYIHPHFSSCSSSFINKQHLMGRRINTWTVNDEEVIRELIEHGIDGIISDDPGLAVQIRKQVFDSFNNVL